MRAGGTRAFVSVRLSVSVRVDSAVSGREGGAGCTISFLTEEAHQIFILLPPLDFGTGSFLGVLVSLEINICISIFFSPFPFKEAVS